MPEAILEAPQTPGWIAGLPDDLKGNDAFKDFKTVGDFGKDYLERVIEKYYAKNA